MISSINNHIFAFGAWILLLEPVFCYIALGARILLSALVFSHMFSWSLDLLFSLRSFIPALGALILLSAYALLFYLCVVVLSEPVFLFYFVFVLLSELAFFYICSWGLDLAVRACVLLYLLLGPGSCCQSLRSLVLFVWFTRVCVCTVVRYYVLLYLLLGPWSCCQSLRSLVLSVCTVARACFICVFVLFVRAILEVGKMF